MTTKTTTLQNSNKTIYSLVTIGLVTIVSMISVRYLMITYGDSLIKTPTFTSAQSQNSSD